MLFRQKIQRIRGNIGKNKGYKYARPAKKVEPEFPLSSLTLTYETCEICCVKFECQYFLIYLTF